MSIFSRDAINAIKIEFLNKDENMKNEMVYTFIVSDNIEMLDFAFENNFDIHKFLFVDYISDIDIDDIDIDDIDIDYIDIDMTLLMIAVRNNSCKIVQYLLNKGVGVNIINSYGKMAIDYIDYIYCKKNRDIMENLLINSINTVYLKPAKR